MIMNKREEALNVLLSNAWDEYTVSIQSGEVKELESKYTQLVSTVVADVIPNKENGEPSLD